MTKYVFRKVREALSSKSGMNGVVVSVENARRTGSKPQENCVLRSPTSTDRLFFSFFLTGVKLVPWDVWMFANEAGFYWWSYLFVVFVSQLSGLFHLIVEYTFTRTKAIRIASSRCSSSSKYRNPSYSPRGGYATSPQKENIHILEVDN